VRTRAEISQLLQANLIKSQTRMKWYAERKRVDKEYKCGDLVYLKPQPYRQNKSANTSFHKLAAWYYGPCKVIKRIEKVACRLDSY